MYRTTICSSMEAKMRIETPEPAVPASAALPNTRSGKIMRRILRKIAEDECANLGDVSTRADPGVVDGLIRERRAAS